ncbi:MAG: transcription factor S [Candidatus Poseidoniales archaeon]|nr:transcription factor S [Euryarchaeota archaeon]OUX25748.1 MAG: hypothetical protein CBE15_00095 [Euryarchaeota archaeon TMED255]RCH74561.1 MAG: transcription factor S [Candidatus Poseidoniales archaeon]HII49436.1 transcription factor S [Candidatus Thalassarchaeaceae archaeon]RAH08669.1 MAG: transcription factor S [Euryarchaeota archaeon]|tara:strand:+ start:157 stop:513 length:357 start_codon:yes stop_codon:yes gene_type:complete
MFCPKCGELSFPDPSGIIKCPNHACGYNGPINQNLEIDGKEIDLVNASSTSKASDLKHLKEVIAESEGQGVLQEGSLMCPKCDCQRIYVELRQTRSSDEPETKIGTCADCGHKFREYA